MRNGLSALICAVFLSFSMGVFASSDHVVLVVNDDVITSSQLQKTKLHLEKSGGFSSSGKSKQKQLMDYVINEHLQLQQAKMLGITVSDKEVDEALKRIADSNRISVAMLQESIKRSGMSLNDYRDEMKKRLVFQKLAAARITKPPVVTEEEVSALLKQYQTAVQKKTNVSEYHVVDFLLPFKQNDASERDALLKQANDLRDRLMNGKSLSGIEHEVEDLGVRSRHELPELFLKNVKTLKSGEYSEPFAAANGVHILKAEMQNQSAPMLTRDEARQLVLDQKLQKIMQEWLDELRAKSYVEIKVNEE